MIRFLLLSMLLLCVFLSDVVSQSWQQYTSDDLELPFAETIIKHDGNWYMGTAGGVFKTSDQGVNWTLVNNNLYDVYGRLRIEGFASVGNVLLGANRWEGIVKTSDGSSWSRPASGLPVNYYMVENMVVIGSRVIAIIQDYDSGSYDLYYSDNQGTNWTKGAGLAGVNEDPDLHTEGTKAYVTHSNASGDDEFIYETSDGAVVSAPSFSTAYPGARIERIKKSGDYMIVFGQEVHRYDLVNTGWEDLTSAWTNGIGFISAGGNGVDRLYASVLDGNMDVGFYTSADHGSSWTALSPTMTTGKSFAMGIFATGDELMAAFIDDGIHYSSNSGASLALRNNGGLATDFDDMVVSGDKILASLFISGVYASGDNGLSWAKSNNGIPADALQNVSGYVKYYNFPDENSSPNKVLKSINDGISWSELGNPVGFNNLQVSGANGNVLFGYADDPSEAYFISDNGGASWTNVTVGMPADFKPVKVTGDGTIAYMAGFDTSTPDKNYINIYTSADNGASGWMLHMNGITTANLDSSDDDDDIHLVTPAIGEAYLNIRYTGWDNKLLRWNVNTWEEVDATGANNLDLESMAFNNGVLYISNWNNGVFMSGDNGDTFTEMTGLPDGLSAEIFLFKDDDVIISTHRGLWKYIGTPTDIDSAESGVELLSPNPAHDLVRLGMETMLVSIYSLNGQKVLDVVPVNNQISVAELNKGIYVLRMKTDSGTISRKLIKK